MRYEYRTIRVARGAWPNVIAAVHEELAEQIRDAGGLLFGFWRGEIGWFSDEGVLLSAWPRAVVPSDTSLGNIPHLEWSVTQLVESTVRPVDPEPPSDDGVYAHRWFEVSRENEAEFVRLSDEAWPGMEAAFPGVRIIGLWRLVGSEEGPASLLLITRYPTLEAWEQSRPYNPALVPEAREKFTRRAELTRRTIVRIGRLTRPN